MTATNLIAAKYDAPMGTLTLVASPAGLRAILWPNDGLDGKRVRLADVDEGTTPILEETARQLDEYFAGERASFDLPLDPAGTEFQLAVWHSLADVPYGQTTTYGEQADRLGRPTAVRAVAAANGRNPISVVLPCHRIVGSDGSLTGFAGGLDAKSWLLEHERSHTEPTGAG